MQKVIFSIVLLLVLNNCFSQIVIDGTETKSLPKISNYVNDFEEILMSHQENILKVSVESFDKETNQKIIIVTVDSIEPFKNIFDYSLNLANKIEFKCEVVIVISKKLRQIQNNDSVLEKLTNQESKNIIENYILPEFKKDKYFKGLLKGIAEIKKELN